MKYARIRSVLEYGAQVWGAVINGLQSKAIENCQMKALQVILGAQSSSYSVNRAKLSVELLSDRREELMTKFAISTFKDPRFRKWYTPFPPSSLVFRDKGHPKPPRLWVPLVVAKGSVLIRGTVEPASSPASSPKKGLDAIWTRCHLD